nr:hypothetical protein OH837_09370 [Streptomyces canus]
MQVFSDIGAGAFGVVIGWIAYRTLRRSDGSRIRDLTTVIAALGGAAVVDTRFADPELFSSYGLGLATGFFSYFLIGAWLDRRARKRAEVAAAATNGAAAPEARAVETAENQPIGAHTWQGEGPSFQRSSPRKRNEFEQ